MWSHPFSQNIYTGCNLAKHNALLIFVIICAWFVYSLSMVLMLKCKMVEIIFFFLNGKMVENLK